MEAVMPSADADADEDEDEEEDEVVPAPPVPKKVVAAPKKVVKKVAAK
jgi:hypothetical protein